MRLGIPHDFRNGYRNEIIVYDKTGLALYYSEKIERKIDTVYPFKNVDYQIELMDDGSGNYHTVGYKLPNCGDKIFYIQEIELEVRDYTHTRLHLWHVMIDYEYEK